MRLIFDGLSWYSISTDGWTSRAHKSYQALILHYIDAATAEHRKFVLDVWEKKAVLLFLCLFLFSMVDIFI